MRIILSVLMVVMAISSSSFAQTPVPMSTQPSLTYSENFSDIANWTNGFAAGTGANRYGSVTGNATGTIPSGERITTATTSFVTGSSGGVQKGTESIMLLSTGAADNSTSTAIDLFLDFTGVNAGTISFDWTSVTNSTGNRAGSLRIYSSTDGTSFTELTGAAVLNFVNGTVTSGSITGIILPTTFNNSATARLRLYYHNGTGGTTGSRPKISIDNLTVTATSGSDNVSIAAGTNAAEPATDGTFAIGFTPTTSSANNLDYAFTGAAGFGTDYTVSFSSGTPSTSTATGTLQNIPSGTSSITVTITPLDDSDIEGTETVILTLSNPPAAYPLGTASANINLLDNDVAPVVAIAAGNNAAEPSTNGTFTISYTVPTTTTTTLDYNLSGTATMGVDYNATFSTGTALSGTLTVPAGTTSITVTITPVDDSDIELVETIILDISNPSGGYSTGNTSSGINLTSNDIASTVSVVAGNNAVEPSSHGSFAFTLSTPAPAGGATINYTLTGTATLNSDYTDPQNGTLTIIQGNLSGNISLSVTDDALAETAETIQLTIDNITAPYTINSASASINLIDNEYTPVSLTGTYNQDFNTLASTGINNPMTIPGWGIYESLGGARDNKAYASDNGASNSGDTYSYGTTAGERALGSLTSGSLASSYGAYFINNTGTTATTIRISYTGKQWRLGTASRQDRLAFQYSLNAVNFESGVWIDYPQLDFLTPNTTGTGTKNGNDPANQSAIAYTLTGLSIPSGSTLFIRWNDGDASGADDGLSIDDFSIEINPVDNANPVLTSLAPASSSVNVPVYIPASITFNEDIIKATGNIYVKRLSDNVTIQTINVATSAVTTSGNRASFNIEGLAYSTAYYVEAEAGAFTDAAGNSYAGFTGNTTWTFTTMAPPPPGTIGTLYSFNNCTSTITEGFLQFSETGASVWACTPFGRNPNRTDPLLDSIYGVQMNGFAAGTNVPNADWLISPSFDLTATIYPLLSFYSRTAFNGQPLQLKVSVDYVMGNPNAATWIDVNGKFPGLASNSWTLSSGINLAAFKQPNVHFAFVYTSSDDDGARWTLDDIVIENSATPPPPSLTITGTDMQFGFAAAGNNVDKTFSIIGNDLTGDINLSTSGDFLLSLNQAGLFTPSITLTQASFNNLQTTVYVRFSPSANNQNYNNIVLITTTDIPDADTVFLKGTSIDPINTLEVVNWNIEWFGSTLSGQGPGNVPQQEANVQTIMQNIDADIYALIEVVDESALQRVVSNLPGYSYLISDFGSYTNTTTNPPSALALAQKQAFVFKTSLFSNISTGPLVSQGVNSPADLSNPAYNYFSSGRFPYMMTADVTLMGNTRTIRFVLLHAKANTSPTATSYARRKNGADTLRYTLNTLYPNDQIIILGDINDDLDSTITADINPRITSYSSFMNDPATFTAPTLSLSLAGKKSTVSYNDMIDHVLISNEMQPYFMSNSAAVLNDVAALVTNYGSTTSDHYPIFTRFAFDGIILPVSLINFTASKQNTVARLTWTTTSEINSSHFIIERSSNGSDWQVIGNVAAAGNSQSDIDYSFTDHQPLKGMNYYRLKSVDLDSKTAYSAIRPVNFTAAFTYSIYPNPAKDLLFITTDAVAGWKEPLQILNTQGQVVVWQPLNGNTQPVAVNISALTSGVYFIRFTAPDGAVFMEKLIKQ